MLEVLKGGHERKRERSGRNEGVGFFNGCQFLKISCWVGSGCWLMTQRVPDDGPFHMRRSVIGISFFYSVTVLRMPQSSHVTQMEYLVLTYMFLTQIPSILAKLKHQFLDF